MKALINTFPIQLFTEFPKFWEDIFHFDKAEPEVHYEAGFREVILPEEFDDKTHVLAELYYVTESTNGAMDDYFTYMVVPKSPEELEADRKSLIPYSISPAQGRIMMAQMPGVKEGETLLDNVLAMLPESKAEPIQIYWEYAQTWNRDSQFIAQMAAALGMTNAEIDEFFIQAEKINN